MNSMDQDVVKAISQPKKIKLVIIVMVGVLVLNFVGKRDVWPALHRYLAYRDPVEAMRRFKLVMLVFGLSLLPLVVYVALVARRIIRSEQFPYPGAKVWRDTRIVRGRLALIRGWAIAFCALCFLGLGIYAAYIPYMVESKGRADQSHGSGK